MRGVLLLRILGAVRGFKVWVAFAIRIAVYGSHLSLGREREIRNLVNYNCERGVIFARPIAMHT